MISHVDFKEIQAQTTPYPFLIEVDRAEGSYIYSKDGKKYLDMIAGVAVNNIGHNHPKVINAIVNQVNRHLHVMVYGEFIQQSQFLFAQKLISLLPPQLNCVYTVNSGTEANEGALKLAKRITNRHEIISCYGAYHGSTHGSLSVSGNESKKAPFRPLLPGIKRIRHNAIQDLKYITDQTACVILEPIQGDAGVRSADNNYLKALRERCSKTGAQLIFDEIQCGMGRTGKLFAFEHSGVAPDILTLGKALGGGMPIGAFISSQAKMKLLTENPMLGHITTFGGHPVNCAAGLACLEVLSNEIDFAEVEQKGAYIEKNIACLKKVIGFRRKGLMIAIDLKTNQEVERIVKRCLENEIITFWFLSHPNSFRLSPPLNISWTEIEKATAVISKIIQES